MNPMKYTLPACSKSAAIVENDEDDGSESEDYLAPKLSLLCGNETAVLHHGELLGNNARCLNRADVAGAAPTTPVTENEFFSFPCAAAQLQIQKKRFLVFLRILLKYLEVHDNTSCQKVKGVLRAFAALLHRQQEESNRSSYDSQNEATFLLELYTQVKSCVKNDADWQVSYSCLYKFLLHRKISCQSSKSI